jgi:lipid-binding SYLF domain-containing protein
MHICRIGFAIPCFWLLLGLVGAYPARAADTAELRDLVDKARITFESFIADPNLGWFRDHVKDAKGILIVPQLLKGAFFVGGAGGSGVLLVRDEKNRDWSEPAFYTLGSASFGFQFGAQASEVILLVMTNKGINSLLATTFTLGADASIAVGPIGGGIEGATAPNLSVDLLSFARSKGLFAGISLEGAVVAAQEDDNSSYYGRTVQPADILVRRTVSNSHSAVLRSAVTKAMTAVKTQPAPESAPSPPPAKSP